MAAVHQQESEVGKFFCKRCNALLDTSSPGLRGLGSLRLCPNGHFATLVISGWTTGFMTFVFTAICLHVTSLIALTLPQIENLAVKVLLTMGGLALLLGLKSRDRRNSGGLDMMSVGWREQVGFGMGVLLGTLVVLLLHDLYSGFPLCLDSFCRPVTETNGQ